jgi:hypothetical protein
MWYSVSKDLFFFVIRQSYHNHDYATYTFFYDTQGIVSLLSMDNRMEDYSYCSINLKKIN